MSKIRTLLVEHHLLLRDRIGRLLQIPENVEVVAQASNVADTFKIVHERGVDLILMDLSAPGIRGGEAVQQLKEVAPSAKVIILLPTEDSEYQVAATRQGADACVPKDQMASMLLPAIQQVCGHTGARERS